MSYRNEDKNDPIINIRIRELKFLGHMMWKVGLENLIPTGHTEGKLYKKKTDHNLHKEVLQMVGRLEEITKKNLISAKNGRKLWRALIATSCRETD